jgi:hypothetical protein
MSFTSKLTTLAAAGAGGDSYWANNIVNGDDRQSNLNWLSLTADNGVVFGGYYHQSNGYNRADTMELDADGNYVRGIRVGSGTQEQTNSWGGTVGTSGYVVSGGYDLSSGSDPAFFVRNPTTNSFAKKFEDSPGIATSVCTGMYTIGNYIYACIFRYINSSDTELAIARGNGTTFSMAGSRSRGVLDDAGDGLYISQQGKCDVTADSNDNMYFVAESAYSGQLKFYLASLNSSFTQRWIYSYTYTYGIDNIRIVTDSSNNVYIVGYTTDYDYRGITVLKFDSSGSEVWQKRFWAGGNDTFSYSINGVAVDSNDNLIIMTHSLNEPSTNNYIYNFDFFKVNSSGTVTDGCRWRGNNSGVRGEYSYEKQRLALDANDNMYACWAYRHVGLSDAEYRRRFVTKFTFDTQGQSVSGAWTFDPTNYYTSSATATYYNSVTRNNSPNIDCASDGRTITNSTLSFTDDTLTLNTDLTESVTSL